MSDSNQEHRDSKGRVRFQGESTSDYNPQPPPQHHPPPPEFGEWSEGVIPLRQEYLGPREQPFHPSSSRHGSEQNPASQPHVLLPVPPPPPPPPPLERTITEEREFGSQETLKDDSPRGSVDPKSSDPAYPSPAHIKPGMSPPSAPLRSALRPTARRTVSESHFVQPSLSRTSSLLEEGGVRGERDSPNHNVFNSLFQGFSLNRQRSRPRSRASSVGSVGSARSTWSDYRKRNESTLSLQGAQLVDEFDPLVTGVRPRGKKKRLRMRRRSSQASVVSHIEPVETRHKFILRLAKALMAFGAPSHRIESQLQATARILEVEASFVHMPSIIIASFDDPDTGNSITHFVKCQGRLVLGSLQEVHDVYKQVVHDAIGAADGLAKLSELLKRPLIYGPKARCFISFACASLICPIAFGGSFLDTLVAGLCGVLLCALQVWAAEKSPLYSSIFEISVSILISFIARLLSSIIGNKQWFCYSAISSSGVVLILPGFLVLCSALELASKNYVSGSVKMVYAIVYSLFLGFSLTVGSDLGFLLWPAARHIRELATRSMEQAVYVHGSFVSDNSTAIPSFSGVFTYQNKTDIPLLNEFHYRVKGCYRDPAYPWYLQPFPWWTMFITVPLYSIAISSWNMQPVKTFTERWLMFIMVLISCTSFTVNYYASKYIYDRGDIVSTLGAFTVGFLGNSFSRIAGVAPERYKGPAFVVMVTGILFLVPSGIAAVGGFASNYRGQSTDQYLAGLTIGLRMVQVAIGITVGLFVSGLMVYWPGSKNKHTAVFAL